MTTPSSWYEPSPRPFPRSLPYPDHPLVLYAHRMPNNGILHWRGRALYISDCLGGVFPIFSTPPTAQDVACRT